MQEEIKNILKCLEMDMLDNKQIEILLDYITNLQEENEYSNHCNEELRKKITNLEYKIKRLEEELEYQKQAEIEYNEKHLKLMNIYNDLKSRNEEVIEFCNYSLNNPWCISERELLGAILKKAQGVDKE